MFYIPIPVLEEIELFKTDTNVGEVCGSSGDDVLLTCLFCYCKAQFEWNVNYVIADFFQPITKSFFFQENMLKICSFF